MAVEARSFTSTSAETVCSLRDVLCVRLRCVIADWLSRNNIYTFIVLSEK